MKAIGYRASLPITEAESLINFELPQPQARGRDLLIRVNAIAVNPVDYKIRQRVAPEEEYKVIGWDAAGEVVAIGEEVTLFKPGDMVYYAGDLNRPGCNAEFQLVDERLVGKKPRSLSDAAAAALPLTGITAWELLFEHLGIEQQHVDRRKITDELILVVGAAGGVGSILVQIVKAITGATVIATASRESSVSWIRELGADHTINHYEPLLPQIEAMGFKQVTHIASLNGTGQHFEVYTECLSPFGKICMIDDPDRPLDVMQLKRKSQSLHIEFMFARSLYATDDMDKQGKLLNQLAELVDQGHIQSTEHKHLGLINADNLKAAHAELESGSVIGKIVLEGF